MNPFSAIIPREIERQIWPPVISNGNRLVCSDCGGGE
jgi:hypothetical protein